MSSQSGITHMAFMAYVTDGASHAALRGFVGQLGLPDSVVQPGGLDVLTKIIGESQSLPRVVVVDIDGAVEPLPALVRLIEALEGVTRVIVVGSANDVRLYRGLLAAGAVDYVVKPLSGDLLQAAHDLALKQSGDSHDHAGGARIIPIIGARGGVGATTIAVNLGWLLAHRYNQTTALFDLDLQFGTSALALDLVPGQGLREALQTPGRLDSLLVASSMVSESDRFSILGAEEPLEDPLQFDNAAASAVLAELKGNFQYILVDLPRHMVAAQKRLLTEADTILIVAEQTLAAIRDVVRLKTALKTMAPQAKLLTVVARVAPNRGGDRSAQVDQSSFEKGIGEKIVALIPEDAVPVAIASNKGQALGKAAPQAPVTLALTRLAEALAGRRTVETKPAVWARIAGTFRKSKPRPAK